MDTASSLFSEIFSLRAENGCWNELDTGDRHYPELNHYVPKYKATLWVLILLADMQYRQQGDEIRKPMKIISDHFRDRKAPIYSLGRSHFPIPCLNGNMLYLHQYFRFDPAGMTDSIVDFFARYQRFDDGDFKTPSAFPYCSNRSCYGRHTCYWGVVKLLKGLCFIPEEERSENARKLITRCIDYILLHEVCYSSRLPDRFIQKNIDQLTFPNMYNSDFLEILWLLKREKVTSVRVLKALQLLKDKKNTDGTWKIERRIPDLVVPVGRKTGANHFITRRAGKVMAYYDGLFQTGNLIHKDHPEKTYPGG
jgi:hypothetical protein